MKDFYSSLNSRNKTYFYIREYVIHGSKIHKESGLILLTFELTKLSGKRLRRFELPSADLDHTMIMGGGGGGFPLR